MKTLWESIHDNSCYTLQNNQGMEKFESTPGDSDYSIFNLYMYYSEGGKKGKEGGLEDREDFQLFTVLGPGDSERQ